MDTEILAAEMHDARSKSVLLESEGKLKSAFQAVQSDFDEE